MRTLYSILKWLGGLALVGTLLGVIAAAGVYFYLAPQLPDVDNLRDVRFQTPLRIYSADNKLIGEFGEKRRTPITFDQIPPDFVHALQAAEDANFFEHFGIDPKGLLRAAVQLASTGHIQSGGSTITMQVAKNFFLTRERTFKRKFMEILLALRIDHELSKEEILQLYVNKIYLGQRAYGIEAASTVYYGKHIQDLSLAQMAMIAGLPKAPSANNPITNPDRAIERRNWILDRMLNLGFIDKARHDAAIVAPVTASYHGADIELHAPYIAEMVRADLYPKYGDDLYTEGLKVYTTINSKLQASAVDALHKGLIDYSVRHGYRGPEKHLDLSTLDQNARLSLLKQTPDYAGLLPALVVKVDKESVTALTADQGEIEITWNGLSWAKPYKTANYAGPAPKRASDILQPGDLIRILKQGDSWQLTQIPQVQGAIVAMNPANGAIQALSGGFSFDLNKFNRATQAYRQPGSNIKPFLYSAALSNGFTPASIINDSPVVFHDVSLESNWRPENDNGKFGGPTRLRVALYQSRNLVSIRLMRALGIQKARDFILRFGFTPDKLPSNLSLALGTADVTPLQIVTGYAALANGGFKVAPYLIDRIENSTSDAPIFQAQPLRACPECTYTPTDSAAADSAAASLASASSDASASAAQSSIRDAGIDPSLPEGVAPRIITPRTDFLIYNIMQDVINRGTGRRALVLKRPDLAGKTGTTNDQKDAWFSGFNRKLVATAWVGFDQPTTLGRHEFGATAALPVWINFMRDALKDVPESGPTPPPGISSALIDPATGKLAYPNEPNAITDYFKTEELPTEHARNPAQKQSAPTTEQIFGY